MIGDAEDNRIEGGDGDDLLLGGEGADTLVGGFGRDTVSYEKAETSVTVSLGEFGGIGGTASGGSADGDMLSGIEQLIGGAYDDILTGDRLVNNIRGGSGADTLTGAGGADTLSGGGGDDQFVFGTGFDGETITDFQDGDRIRVMGASSIDDFTTIKASMSNTVIEWNGEMLTLADVSRDMISSEDFIFG